MTQLDMIPLGKTDLRITPLGLGAWQWGDRMMWGFGEGYSTGDVRAVFDATLEAGINWIDTAELYGRGTSERLLGQFIHASGVTPIVATKFAPLPWRVRQGELLKALRASLNRLNLSRVDLYQIHFPMVPVPIETWMTALAEAVKAGLTRAVGVSNYNVEQTLRAHAALAKCGVALASNQVEYSLLQRASEKSGLVKVCRELGVTIIAYSPIGKGVLSGKYTSHNPPPGPRARRYNREYLAKVQPLIGLLKEIGQAHDGRTPSQVSLNWLMCKGAVPIPGAKTVQQAKDNAGALGWRLSDEEVRALDQASDQLIGDR
jgi:aryl-alcohol dehydrogenase-like predicted oxidoreductase